MTAFDRREDAFEKKFVHDEELRFKAEARRDKLLALWAAEKLGRSGPAAEEYVDQLLVAELEGRGEASVFQKIKADFERAGLEVSDHRLQRKMDELLAKALAEVRKTG
jgi:hypothetical protein